MNILLVTNKTLNRNGISRIDIGYWNIYVPLLQLGHEVYFYDTVQPEEKDFSKLIENIKPDLIFCCLTGNKNITPYEPLKDILNETKKGRTKTFNWFCDDTWRFDSFSKNICHMFNYCSTPEPSYVEQYKKIGYDNILIGNWHTNLDLYPNVFSKHNDVSFCGHLNFQRHKMINKIKNENINILTSYGCSYEDMIMQYCTSKIGINFSINENGTEKKTQMKLRMFEIPAANSLLITEYHKGIEEFFEIDKEIITFTEEKEMIQKIKYLLKNENIINYISKNAHSRMLKEHNSKIRLANLLKQIV